ncbi:unnamed protein product [Cyprideis torosa]|uniref:Uncharacterized protein n=1 Tax=Cyprideis torosa TaxID=163714 RepID=A0A7R8WAG1_9CRUS|nr:unnamed protein product [Cyprideis torosa]CAG0886312.1 unnamed protein product [Cyprideis torosa]
MTLIQRTLWVWGILGLYGLITFSADGRAHPCPPQCECVGRTVDCSYRGLRSVPEGIPNDAEKIELQGNNLTAILVSDFRHLKKLRSLTLMDNQIHTVESGAFEGLISLERLRLSHNRLGRFDGLIAGAKKLRRLDLSHNRIGVLGRKAFRGVPGLKNLQLDNNMLTCIDHFALRHLNDLEVLVLRTTNELLNALEEIEAADVVALVIEPPDVREETDEDSDDEEEPPDVREETDEDSDDEEGGDTSRLTGHQLRAAAHFVRRQDADIVDDSETQASDSSTTAATAQTQYSRGIPCHLRTLSGKVWST